jgi:hypothetical protein
MKKIEFIPNSEHTGQALNPPAPSRGFIPQWYKDSTRYTTGNDLTFSNDGEPNKNYKLCVPFLDIMTSGYIIELPYDVHVEKIGDRIAFNWNDAPGLVSARRNLKGMPRPAGCLDQAYAWTFFWGVKTPVGYSAIITHPFNRHDLPFITTSGIVESDNFSQGGEIPFFLKADFEGMIPAGTPIAQVIPFKREDWVSEAKEYDDTFFQQQVYALHRNITGAYKRLFWRKKNYD